jgi:hypothetical protein
VTVRAFSLMVAPLLASALAACATTPQPALIVAEEDPAPLRLLLSARPAPPPAVAATLEASARGPRGRAGFAIYLLLAPGAARIEVPGEMGATLFLAVAREDGAFVMPARGNGCDAASSPPPAFPLPPRLDRLYRLWAGMLPEGAERSACRAYRLDNGERALEVALEGGEALRYSFAGDALSSLRWSFPGGEAEFFFGPAGPSEILLAGDDGATVRGAITESLPADLPPPLAFSPLPGMAPLAGRGSAP